MSESVPKGFFHPCPYQGLVKALNVSLAEAGVTKQFLKGRYKITARAFDAIDSEIITFNFGLEI